MPNVFTNFVTSRFIDSSLVVEALRECAVQLRSRHKEIERIYLFGSFAKGIATPRSDADVALQATMTSNEKRSRLLDSALEVFSKAPVPVDIHLIGPDDLTSHRGLSAMVLKEGIEI